MTDNQYEAKEWLNRMFGASQEVESIRRTLETVLAEMGGVAKYSQDFSGHNPKASEDRLARYSTISAQLEQRERDLYEEDTRTEQIIEKLSEDEKLKLEFDRERFKKIYDEEMAKFIENR